MFRKVQNTLITNTCRFTIAHVTCNICLVVVFAGTVVQIQATEDKTLIMNVF